MNSKTGFYSALTVAATTVLLAAGILPGSGTLSFTIFKKASFSET